MKYQSTWLFMMVLTLQQGCGDDFQGFRGNSVKQYQSSNQDSVAAEDNPEADDATAQENNNTPADPVDDEFDDSIFEILLPMNPRNDAPQGTKLYDIVTHLPARFGNTYYDDDEITWGHETSHGIHSYIRTDLARKPGVNGFYVLKNRYITFPEPHMRKSDIAAFVPQSLRGSRYDLYVRGQQDWDDTPLYIWDEWNAYVNGTEVGVEYVEKGLWTHGGRDGVAGAIEFNSYAIALAMAVKQRDPNYFATNPKFAKFLAFNLQRSTAAFLQGRDYQEFKMAEQEQLYKAFLTGNDTAAMRSFLVGLYGKSWCMTNLGDGNF